MANELQTMVQNTLQRMAKALEDAIELRVETRCMVLDGRHEGPQSEERSQLLARTVLGLDGDMEVLVPVTRDSAGQVTQNEEMFALHQRNVQQALDYRADLLKLLLDAAR